MGRKGAKIGDRKGGDSGRGRVSGRGGRPKRRGRGVLGVRKGESPTHKSLLKRRPRKAERQKKWLRLLVESRRVVGQFINVQGTRGGECD